MHTIHTHLLAKVTQNFHQTHLWRVTTAQQQPEQIHDFSSQREAICSRESVLGLLGPRGRASFDISRTNLLSAGGTIMWNHVSGGNLAKEIRHTVWTPKWAVIEIHLYGSLSVTAEVKQLTGSSDIGQISPQRVQINNKRGTREKHQ